MTLVLTELSRVGIAMAADTAVIEFLLAPDRTCVPTARLGTTKLFPIPKLQARVSYWGLGEIGRVNTELWLRAFINNEDRYNSLREFAILLQNDLRDNIQPIDPNQHRLGTIGFHVAGFVQEEGIRGPAFWHVHNGRSQLFAGVDPSIVNANCDCPPQRFFTEYDSHGLAYITRNGDIEAYARLFESLKQYIYSLQRELGWQIPSPPTLEGIAEFLRAQINIVSEIYRISDRVRSIGGEVTTLTISQRGIENYGTR